MKINIHFFIVVKNTMVTKGTERSPHKKRVLKSGNIQQTHWPPPGPFGGCRSLWLGMCQELHRKGHTQNRAGFSQATHVDITVLGFHQVRQVRTDTPSQTSCLKPLLMAHLLPNSHTSPPTQGTSPPMQGTSPPIEDTSKQAEGPPSKRQTTLFPPLLTYA